MPQESKPIADVPAGADQKHQPMTPDRIAEIERVNERLSRWTGSLIPELLAEVYRLQSAVFRLANTERDLAETQLVLEQQDRDLERQRDRIAALEAALSEALYGWENQYARDPEENPRDQIARLCATLNPSS